MWKFEPDDLATKESSELYNLLDCVSQEGLWSEFFESRRSDILEAVRDSIGGEHRALNAVREDFHQWLDGRRHLLLANLQTAIAG
jgi:hypothetical protein